MVLTEINIVDESIMQDFDQIIQINENRLRSYFSIITLYELIFIFPPYVSEKFKEKTTTTRMDPPK